MLRRIKRPRLLPLLGFKIGPTGEWGYRGRKPRKRVWLREEMDQTLKISGRYLVFCGLGSEWVLSDLVYLR